LRCYSNPNKAFKRIVSDLEITVTRCVPNAGVLECRNGTSLSRFAPVVERNSELGDRRIFDTITGDNPFTANKKVVSRRFQLAF